MRPIEDVQKKLRSESTNTAPWGWHGVGMVVPWYLSLFLAARGATEELKPQQGMSCGIPPCVYFLAHLPLTCSSHLSRCRYDSDMLLAPYQTHCKTYSSRGNILSKKFGSNSSAYLYARLYDVRIKTHLFNPSGGELVGGVMYVDPADHLKNCSDQASDPRRTQKSDQRLTAHVKRSRNRLAFDIHERY